MSRRPQSKSELEQHLQDHLHFLKASGDAFDAGCDAEAKRLAVSVRVLVHDTDSSHSLLGQLDRLGTDFVSTAIPHDPRNISTHAGLVMIAGREKASRYVTMLDGSPYRRTASFPDWWNEAVFIDDTRSAFTRRAVVLAIANQDGGAHVDPKLNDDYARLTRDNSLGWVYSDSTSTVPIPQAGRATMRQIAHEVLVSLDPGYGKKIEHEPEAFFGGAMVYDEVPPE